MVKTHSNASSIIANGPELFFAVQTPKAWDEASLRIFYDAIVQHGTANFRRVRNASLEVAVYATTCGQVEFDSCYCILTRVNMHFLNAVVQRACTIHVALPADRCIRE